MSVLAPEQYAVYLITDNPSRYAGDFVENIERAVAGGATIVQYRDKESDGRRLYERCLRLKSMLDARGVPLVVNNLPGLALAVGAAAVHVGQDEEQGLDEKQVQVQVRVGRDEELELDGRQEM